MQAVADLSAVVGIAAACDALGIARAAFYRRRPRDTALAPRFVLGMTAAAGIDVKAAGLRVL
jgi:hypothetical protein